MKGTNAVQIVFVMILALICFALGLAGFAIPGLYLHQIKKLHQNNCECSANNYRHYITFYSVYTYVLVLALILLAVLLGKKTFTKFVNNNVFKMVTIPLTFAFAICLFLYQNKVNEEACKCALKTKIPKVMKIHSIIVLVMASLSVFMMGVTAMKLSKRK